ncbi:hypothetical protein [Sorangium sp. So ce381]|uniref:hypothetical protein n=1 Tax=Sorangium sp. So ce381 TaxID=3133307 RepID=UPI003F5C9DB7
MASVNCVAIERAALGIGCTSARGGAGGIEDRGALGALPAWGERFVRTARALALAVGLLRVVP